MNKNELRAVVEKAQNGEKTAFEKLYKEFHEKLYFFVLKNVGDKHTAEDITEDSFLASMEGIGSLKEPEHYETWLHSIAFNKCRMYFRQKGREDNISLDDENLSEDIHADDTVMLPEDYADSKELKRCLKKVIEGLKPEQRSAVILYYYDGMPLKKVSEILEISEIAALAEAMGVPFERDMVEVNLKILSSLAPEATTSMQRDVMEGKDSEIDGLVYEVVRMGERYHVPVPMYAKVAEKLRENL